MATVITPDLIDSPEKLHRFAAEFVHNWTQVPSLDDPMPHLASSRESVSNSLACRLWEVSFNAKHGRSPNDAEYTEARDTFAAIASSSAERLDTPVVFAQTLQDLVAPKNDRSSKTEMNTTLLKIVTTIADEHFDGKWMLLCYGGTYELLFGAVPGDGVDDRWKDSPSMARGCTSVSGAMLEAIQKELPEIA